MPRSGGTYTRTDGTRTGPTVWQQARDAGVKIVAVGADTHDEDIADALTASIANDGQTPILANLPMSTKRHTGVGNGVARTDYASAGQTQDGSLNWVDGGGTADAITAIYAPVLTALINGQFCYVRATAANATTTPTFAPNGLTAHTIVKTGGVALVEGDISGDGHELILRYDLSNTRWELLNPATIAANLVSDTSPQLGGDLDPNGHRIGWDKGSDTTSASPLVILTDGNYFGVTGTTGFSAMTVSANLLFMLQFDDALTMTHGASLNLPGGANITTAAGDVAICMSTAANTVRVINYTRADGTPIVTEISNDTTPQLGGFLDANGNYIQMETGADIASANPLVIGADGDSFDITGTTGYASQTVAADRHYFTQYDGILVITHGASQVLPGGANITTAAGDIAEWVSTAADTVRCVNYTKADGTAVIEGGGGWEFVSASTASASATVAFTGFEAGYDYLVTASDVYPATDTVLFSAQIGVSGPTYRTTGYFGLSGVWDQAGTVESSGNFSTFIQMTPTNQGSAADEGGLFSLMLIDPFAVTDTYFKGDCTFRQPSAQSRTGAIGGHHGTAESIDAVQFYYSAGNISTGIFKLYRRANV